jgi:hypothetical protein
MRGRFALQRSFCREGIFGGVFPFHFAVFRQSSAAANGDVLPKAYNNYNNDDTERDTHTKDTHFLQLLLPTTTTSTVDIVGIAHLNTALTAPRQSLYSHYTFTTINKHHPTFFHHEIIVGYRSKTQDGRFQICNRSNSSCSSICRRMAVLQSQTFETGNTPCRVRKQKRKSKGKGKSLDVKDLW